MSTDEIQVSMIQLLVPFLPNRKARVLFSATDPTYQRVPHNDQLEEDKINLIWKKRCDSNPSLFNASKFRLSNVSLTPEIATLHLGLTDYRTYVATHHRDARSLPDMRHRALALGNVMVLITVDRHVPFIVRSKASATHPMKLALPGGHAEPDDLKDDATNDNVTNWMAVATRNEALEELFLHDSDICPADQFIFLGVVERLPDRKPSTVHLGHSSLTGDEVKLKYFEGNTKQEESVGIVLQSESQLSALAAHTGNRLDIKQYVPETIGAALLYSQIRECGLAN